MIKSITRKEFKKKLAGCIRSIYMGIMAVCLLPVFTFAQPGEWTWLHGTQNTNYVPNFNLLQQDTFNVTYNPPGLYEACQWTDTSGKFWLFGGISGPINYYKWDNLWEYDPAINRWAWMNGTGIPNEPGYYGTQGVPSLGNVPAARSHGMATWTAKNNDLWFFGGCVQGYLPYNDLWRYNIATNEWTWMKGPKTTQDPGSYGTQGVPDPANLPPARYECVATWVDSAGDLWLFGGFNNASDNFNDLWRFNIATNTWTWMKGSNLPNDPGNFGTREIESASNVPPARAAYAHLKDKHENMWVFGGFDHQGNSFLNDIWRYNPVTNNWVWLNGSKTPDATSIYGTKCVSDTINLPGARMENRACWTDSRGNLWYFGGFILNNAAVSNELWKYCIESNKWTLVSGDTIANPGGSWGTMGMASPTNVPDGRGGSVSWIDTVTDNLYLYGGTLDANLTNQRADLWRFTIDTTCGVCPPAVLPVAGFTADSVICAFDCIYYQDTSTNSTSWIWSFPGGTPSSSTDENPFVCYDSAGVYDVTFIATSYIGSSKVILHNYVKVKAAPPTPNITHGAGDTLYCSTNPDYISYQWYKDTTLIPNATDSMIVTTGSGDYNVKVTNANMCSIAVGINIVGIKEFTVYGLQFIVYPNPAGKEIIIESNHKAETGNLKLNIFDVLGQVCQQSAITNPQSAIKLDVSSLPSGIYFIQISNDSGRWIGRFVKE